MDVLPSSLDAARLFGLPSTHPFVYLASVLQETCGQIEEASKHELLVSVTVSQMGRRNGVLLFASGYLKRTPGVKPSAQVEAQMAVGMDSLLTALQQVNLERRRSRGSGSPTPSEGSLVPTASEMALLADDVVRGSLLGRDNSDLGDDYEDAEGMYDDDADALELPDPDPDSGARVTDEVGAPAAAAADSSTQTRPSPSLSGRGVAEADGPHRVRPPAGVEAAAEDRRQRQLSPPVGDGVAGRPGNVRRYILAETFTLPGLTTAPVRIRMAPGRGSRIAPPDGDLVDVDIPRALVEDTVKELTVSGRGDSLRQRLNEFTALYKYVLDTLVKRQCADPVKREKVNHPYIGITPEAVRGKKVSFTMASGKRWTVTSPTFFNSRNMKIPTTLAVILLMKHTGDPFVHWLIGLFCGGAMAPADVAAPAQATAGKNKTARVPLDAQVRESRPV
ncbi:hypothetical protein I4F81_003498 [Pyropia yezoensis]|uniref:Uncharacterized protein n=1 Tax=Pyropia yezoensis TaxID=2788 RepID=A0ACC3BSM0_PYRYE|nr:hypothetical protein I4F81_003498 [Neopyropia yezoensis]